MGNRKKVGMGLLFTGIALGAGAVTAAFLHKQHRERVYHEAELKAMDELDDMMAEDNSGCTECQNIGDCAPADTCADCEEGQISISEEDDAAEADGPDAAEKP